MATVIVKQQGAGGGDPVEVKWCSDADDLDVMLSVAQLLGHDKDEAPWAPRILEIRVEL